MTDEHGAVNIRDGDPKCHCIGVVEVASATATHQRDSATRKGLAAILERPDQQVYVDPPRDLSALRPLVPMSSAHPEVARKTTAIKPPLAEVE
jgi:hypothetical protein